MDVIAKSKPLNTENIEDEDVSFSFFNMDGKVDLNVGIDSSKAVLNADAFDDVKNKEAFYTGVTEKQNLKEEAKSIKAEKEITFEEMKSSITSINTEGLTDVLDSLTPIPNAPEDLRDITESILDVGDLINQVEEPKERTVEIIQIKADKPSKAGTFAKWVLESFVTNPIRGLFKMLYTALFSLFGYIGGLLKFTLISIILTAVFLILYTNFVNKSYSASDIANQNYTIIKDLILKIIDDFSKAIMALFKK